MTSASVSRGEVGAHVAQALLEREVVLDDPVDDDVDAVARVEVRVRVGLGDAAVRGPAGVADAARRGLLGDRDRDRRGRLVRIGAAAAVRDRLAQLAEVADRAHRGDLAVGEDRDPRGVIAAVLELLQAGEQDLLDRALADVSDDSAHARRLGERARFPDGVEGCAVRVPAIAAAMLVAAVDAFAAPSDRASARRALHAAARQRSSRATVPPARSLGARGRDHDAWRSAGERALAARSSEASRCEPSMPVARRRAPTSSAARTASSRGARGSAAARAHARASSQRVGRAPGARDRDRAHRGRATEARAPDTACGRRRSGARVPRAIGAGSPPTWPTAHDVDGRGSSGRAVLDVRRPASRRRRELARSSRAALGSRSPGAPRLAAPSLVARRARTSRWRRCCAASRRSRDRDVPWPARRARSKCRRPVERRTGRRAGSGRARGSAPSRTAGGSRPARRRSPGPQSVADGATAHPGAATSRRTPRGSRRSAA